MNAPVNPFPQTAQQQAGGAMSRGNEQRAIAEVQAAVMMAKRFPRDPVAAMDKIMNAFARPTLAAVSQYQYAKGGTDVSGPSIRAAEAIAQQWGNIEFGFRELSRGVGADGKAYSEVEAYAWDVESMTRKPLQFIVPHWRDTKRGGYALTEEREIYELVANMAQRRVRACLLSIIPGDVTEAAMRQSDVTLKTTADTSPEAMAKMIEVFADFGVTKEQIEARIQRRIDAIQPAQVVSLKKIYVSLRDGMSTAAEWFNQDEAEGSAEPKAKAETVLPAYLDDQFDADIPGWGALLSKGKKTHDSLIAMLKTRNTLTDKQIELIRALPGKATETEEGAQQ